MSKDAIELSGLSKSTKVYLRMNPIGKIIKDKGLGMDGSVQAFHTKNVLARIIKFMPYRTGATIKVTIAQTNINGNKIVTAVPFAQMLYHGKSRSGRPLSYTRTENPKAGPYWDRALCATEMRAMQADLQRYINRKKGKG